MFNVSERERSYLNIALDKRPDFVIVLVFLMTSPPFLRRGSRFLILLTLTILVLLLLISI